MNHLNVLNLIFVNIFLYSEKHILELIYME